MRLSLLYFGGVRDAVGLRDEVCEVPTGIVDVAALVDHLQGVYPGLRGRVASLRFAVNEEIVGDGSPLSDGDVVALLPPFAGG